MLDNLSLDLTCCHPQNWVGPGFRTGDLPLTLSAKKSRWLAAFRNLDYSLQVASSHSSFFFTAKTRGDRFRSPSSQWRLPGATRAIRQRTFPIDLVTFILTKKSRLTVGPQRPKILEVFLHSKTNLGGCRTKMIEKKVETQELSRTHMLKSLRNWVFNRQFKMSSFFGGCSKSPPCWNILFYTLPVLSNPEMKI